MIRMGVPAACRVMTADRTPVTLTSISCVFALRPGVPYRAARYGCGTTCGRSPGLVREHLVKLARRDQRRRRAGGGPGLSLAQGRRDRTELAALAVMAAREGCRLRWHGALDQVIVEGHEELGFTGIALAPGPPSHVHLEPPDSRPILAQHTQTAPVGNVVALGAIRA